MKCPKCEYLGFETGDRCRNCGYDFSLAVTVPTEPELLLREPEPVRRDADRWLNQLEARLDTVRPVATSSPVADPLASMTLERPVLALPVSQPIPSAPSAPAPVSNATAATQPGPRVLSRSTPALPLFHPSGADGDEPLIKLPPAPRAPLAVRRTPDKPRLRPVPKPVRKVHGDPESDPVLAFAEESTSMAPLPAAATPVVGAPRPAAAPQLDVSGPMRRMIAAALDHLILLSIDAVVIYFTFQIAGVPLSSWQAIPVFPLALFLLMVKGSYFSVFTALGGQTVGKMATGIRVVAEDNREVEPSRAVQRTLAALASVATVGIGFAPALFAGDRRTLHDRVAGTRVVGPLHE
jgi:uncharacterized RDD family membrane protein YckC